MTLPLKLSIVIPTYNRRDVLLSRTLPAIFEQDLSADGYEVIVVVDGSTDATAEALRRLRPPCLLRIIEQPHRGPSAARNSGIQATTGGLVLFLDDDIICGPHLLVQHIEAHNGVEPVVVHGSIYVSPGTPRSVYECDVESWYQNYYARLNAQNGLKWPKDDYLISNSSLPRATLLACGGFDENMPAKEDYELGLRLWKMGVRFQYLPHAVAYEYYVKPSGYVLRHEGEIYGRAEILLSRKHPEYRPFSQVAALGKMVRWKQQWRRINASLPFSFASLLPLPLWACDRLCRFPVMQRAGHRLLNMGRGIVEFRSAAREAGSWKALRSEFGMRLPVLMYHRVGPRKPGTFPSLTVSTRSFERQMRWLALREYTGIRPAHWLRWLREGKGLPEKPVLLTFDDAYADTVEYALPILRRHGFGAVVFVVTDLVGKTNVWDQEQGSAPLQLMSADQIRYWAAQGIEFGAHSRTHPDLTTLNANELTKEVVGSREQLEAILGSPVNSFAYPYGSYNGTVESCVRKAFDMTFLAKEESRGINFLTTDPHALQRTEVLPSDTVADLECRLRWGYNPIVKIRTRLAIRTRLKRVARLVREGLLHYTDNR